MGYVQLLINVIILLVLVLLAFPYYQAFKDKVGSASPAPRTGNPPAHRAAQ